MPEPGAPEAVRPGEAREQFEVYLLRQASERAVADVVLDLVPGAWLEVLRGEAEHGATHVGKNALFSRSDIVSVHLVLSARTRGIVGAEDLARMKPTAYLINTARGPIVDEAALIAALRARLDAMIAQCEDEEKGEPDFYQLLGVQRDACPNRVAARCALRPDSVAGGEGVLKRA